MPAEEVLVNAPYILRCRHGSLKKSKPLFKVRDAFGRQQRGYVDRHNFKREGILVVKNDANPDLERRGLVRVTPVGTRVALTVDKVQIFRYRAEKYA